MVKDFYLKTLMLDIGARDLKKKARKDNTEICVIASKELIDEAVNSMNREEALNYIAREVPPNVKVAFMLEKPGDNGR